MRLRFLCSGYGTTIKSSGCIVTQIPKASPLIVPLLAMAIQHADTTLIWVALGLTVLAMVFLVASLVQ